MEDIQYSVKHLYQSVVNFKPHVFSASLDIYLVPKKLFYPLNMVF